jgi:FK506-binding nuclear protein
LQEEDEQPKAKVAKLEPTKSKQNGAEMNGKASPKEKESPKVKTLAGGLMLEEVKLGAGKEATKGKKVAVLYEGRLKKSGKVFDATKSAPFKFLLGRGEVIKGWDIGVTGMKVGGKRRLVIPPQLAYGNKGAPPAIPPNSTLVFDVELKNVF